MCQVCLPRPAPRGRRWGVSLGSFGWVLFLASVCAAGESGPLPAGQESGEKGKLVVTVHEGEEWLHSFYFMLVLKVTNPPQMAFWLEDIAGNYIAHIFVTRRTALQDWRAAPFVKKENIRRPSSLPIWVHRHWSQQAEPEIQPMTLCEDCHGKHESSDKSTAGQPDLDAVTGATPRSSFTLEWPVPAALGSGPYVVKAEINHSKDFNGQYGKDLVENDPDYSGGKMGSGQPSVLWEGVLEIRDQPSSVALEIVGHGQPAGRTGEISNDLSTLTSASKIVDAIQVRYLPAP